MRIHFEGMGLQGAMTLTMAEAELPDFFDEHEVTWNDTDHPHTAWKASTGAIYPANSTKFGDDWACHQTWEDWFYADHFQRHLEQCNFWFNHKTNRMRASTAPTEAAS